MQDAMLHYMRTNFATQGRTGKFVQRNGARPGGANNAPAGLYPCAPGGTNDFVYIMTSRANPEHWVRLCKLMGREDLVDDPRYATPNERVKNEAEIDAIIAAWTKTRTKQEAMTQVGAVGVPAGAVFDTMELQNDPSFEARGIMQTMQHPTHGGFKMPAWPVRVNGKPPKVSASPMLGQHTADVLTNWLGLGATDIDRLKNEGVV
jgi:formyl-CoA transferase